MDDPLFGNRFNKKCSFAEIETWGKKLSRKIFLFPICDVRMKRGTTDTKCSTAKSETRSFISSKFFPQFFFRSGSQGNNFTALVIWLMFKLLNCLPYRFGWTWLWWFSSKLISCPILTTAAAAYKMTLAIKVVKSDTRIIISLGKSKSLHSV